MTAAEREARRKRAQAEARRRGNQRVAELEARLSATPHRPIDPPEHEGDQVSTSTAKPIGKPTPGRVKAAAPASRRAAQRQPTGRVVATAEVTHNSDLDAAISHMDLEFIQCRDFGHSWRPYSARWLPSENCYESQLRCARCKAIRTRWLSRTGSQVGGGYDYADGYLVKGIGRLTGTDRDKIRLASVLAVLPSDTAAEED